MQGRGHGVGAGQGSALAGPDSRSPSLYPTVKNPRSLISWAECPWDEEAPTDHSGGLFFVRSYRSNRPALISEKRPRAEAAARPNLWPSGFLLSRTPTRPETRATSTQSLLAPPLWLDLRHFTHGSSNGEANTGPAPWDRCYYATRLLISASEASSESAASDMAAKINLLRSSSRASSR